jgi:RHS repeat-associated protein
LSPQSDYILGQGGEQFTEMKMNAAGTAMQWLHTNVWAGSKLLATYDKDGLHFYLDDWLGTRRAQTDYAGVLEQTCQSLPYGDELNCTGGDLQAPTEHHFTGKERDVETGNDYFEARYYSSALGRFMSPDWSAKEVPVPYAKLGDPQSLNLYTYIRNNPLGGVDADGHQQGGVATAPEVAEPTLADILSINASAPFYDLFSLVRLGGSAALVPFALVQPMGDGTFDGALRNPYNAPHRTPGVCYLDRDEPLVETSPLPEAAAGGFGAFGRGRGGRRIPGPIHGNDLSTAVPAQGYSLQDRTTGAILKYGETTLGTGRYTDAYLKAHNANMVFETSGTKKEMHKWQHDKIIEYMQQNGGNRPPLNKNNY